MRGEGCDEDEQGVVSAEMTGEGSAKLRITLLAAGFVIGESTRAGGLSREDHLIMLRPVWL